VDFAFFHGAKVFMQVYARAVFFQALGMVIMVTSTQETDIPLWTMDRTARLTLEWARTASRLLILEMENGDGGKNKNRDREGL
jgi:hypothetical protein